MPSLSTGTLIDGSFTLLRPIGEGGMGEVWLARERPLGREVALKIVRETLSEDRARRIEREARALASLDHPGILPVLRAGTDPATGLRYLATRPVLLSGSDVRRLCDDVFHCPYPHGRVPPPSPGTLPDASSATVRRPLTLADLIDDGKALPGAAVLRIARDLSSALAAAHAVGILHRDVKPSNVLFDAAGRALLVDFGLAKFLGPPHAGDSPATAAAGTLSLDGDGLPKFLGSPAYAAPEAFRGDLPPAPALDWYSFGAVLYEALTGGRPGSAFRPPSSSAPSAVSRAWDAFLRDLLAPDPARRLVDPDRIARRLARLGRALRRPSPARRLLPSLALAALVAFAGLRACAPLRSAVPGGAAPPAAPQRPGEDAPPRPHESDATRSSGEPDAPLSLASTLPARPFPPRWDDVWSGEDRGPLQRLGSFRLAPVDDVLAKALADLDPETRSRIEEGDRIWSEGGRPPSPAAARAASFAWYVADARLRDAFADDSIPLASVRLCHAAVVARLCWAHLVLGERGACNLPYRDALASVAPLAESNPARYAPVRSWLLSERAYAEAEEGRFAEAAQDLKEASLLWGAYAPPDDPACNAQLAALAASLGAMVKAVGDPGNALKPTAGAIETLAALVGDPPVTDAEVPASAALADLLAGCHYRLGDLHETIGNRLEALRNHRAALEIWRGLWRAAGASDPVAAAQVLGRIAKDCAVLDRYAEAVAAWDEMRDALRGPLSSEPARYRPVVAGVLRNTAEAHRRLGDEAAARACEAEAAALESGSDVSE